MQKIKQVAKGHSPIEVMHNGKKKCLLTNLDQYNALDSMRAVEEIKRKRPEVEGILLTMKDARALHEYARANAKDAKFVKQYYKNFFNRNVWLGTISAQAAKDIPLRAALEGGYLVGKHTIMTTTGFLGSINVEREYSWKFPVDEQMLKERGYSLESKNIIFLLDLIAGGEITYSGTDFNRTYTMEILKPEHVKIIDREKTRTMYYGQTAYVGLVSYSIIRTGENEMGLAYFMPDPEFMDDRNFIGKSPYFDKIVLNGKG